MDYFNILNLVKEPFSNSPDPEFFYQSAQHLQCLQQLELSLHLRRGLNVVIGDVGIGKTTLCRHLIRKFADYEDIETHLLLDPHFNNPFEFLSAVAEKFEGHKPPVQADVSALKELVKQYLYQKGVCEKKNVILIIDEGQKIPPFGVEIIREFLNYETNKYKLLQIVIFAQKEFVKTLKQHANFADRINLYYSLKPLRFADTRAMIKFRLKQSSSLATPQTLFSYPALRVIYRVTRGYPRKVVNLCHQCIISMIVQNRTVVDWLLVYSCVRKVFPKSPFTWHRFATAAALVLFVLTVTMAGVAPERLRRLMLPWAARIPNVAMLVQTESEPPKAVTPAKSPVPAAEQEIENKTAQSPPVNPRAGSVKADATASVAFPRFAVQVGAFRNEANAVVLLQNLHDKGYSAYLFHAPDARQKEWFTVRIGDYPDFDAAAAGARELEAKEKIHTAVMYKDSLASASAVN